METHFLAKVVLIQNITTPQQASEFFFQTIHTSQLQQNIHISKAHRKTIHISNTSKLPKLRPESGERLVFFPDATEMLCLGQHGISDFRLALILLRILDFRLQLSQFRFVSILMFNDLYN